MIMEEIWKDIPGYEGKYQASNMGRAKNVVTGKILTPSKSKNGYHIVQLYKGRGTRKAFYLHRAVWIAFNGPIPEGMEINHKDECKTRNCLDNLNLVTKSQNQNWGTRNLRAALKMSYPIVQYDLAGNIVKDDWASAYEVERVYGYDNGNICKCCNGKLKTAYGYKWKYKDAV